MDLVWSIEFFPQIDPLPLPQNPNSKMDLVHLFFLFVRRAPLDMELIVYTKNRKNLRTRLELVPLFFLSFHVGRTEAKTEQIVELVKN